LRQVPEGVRKRLKLNNVLVVLCILMGWRGITLSPIDRIQALSESLAILPTPIRRRLGMVQRLFDVSVMGTNGPSLRVLLRSAKSRRSIQIEVWVGGRRCPKILNEGRRPRFVNRCHMTSSGLW
jgi:hypothetical protein